MAATTRTGSIEREVRMRRSLLLTAVVVVLALPSAAGAQSLPWVAADVGFHTYDMSDVNDLFAGSPIDKITKGFGFGAGVGVDLPKVTLAATYERLTGSTDYSDPTGSIKFDMPANLFMAQAIYRFPTTGTFGLGIGGGIGYISTGAKISLTITGVGSDSQTLEGSSAAYAAFLAGDWKVGTKVSLMPMLGYRYAKIGEVKADGEVVHNDDGSKFEIDYTGLKANLLIRLMSF